MRSESEWASRLVLAQAWLRAFQVGSGELVGRATTGSVSDR